MQSIILDTTTTTGATQVEETEAQDAEWGVRGDKEVAESDVRPQRKGEWGVTQWCF